MSETMACAHCGAALPLPTDLNVMTVACKYCGQQAPVPDLEIRRELLLAEEERREQREEERERRAERKEAEREARRTAKWATIPGLVIGLLVPVIVAFSVIRSTSNVHVPSIGAIPSIPSAWDGKTTLDCHKGDTMDFTGINANVKGVAIRASGGCIINLTGGSIRAETAIQASGGAIINLTGVTIDAPVAIDASGNAVVTVHGGKTIGKVHHSGSAKVIGL